MINKGKARGNGAQLGEYLGNYGEKQTLAGYLKREKNDRVEVLQIRGSAFPDLERSLASWEAEAIGTRCKKPLWHAQMSPANEDRLTRQQQLEAVNILERHLGLEGQARAVVIHEKEGKEHLHVAWSRIDRKTRKARRDSFSYRKNVAAAREIEQRFGLRIVESPAFEKTGTREERREKSKKAATYKEFQKAKRSGFDPRIRQDEITRLWHESDNGKSFRAGLQSANYILAFGDKRDYVVIDKAGDVHSLPKQIKDARTADVRKRFTDIEPASIPQVKEIQRQLRYAWKENAAREQPREEEPTNARQAAGAEPKAPSKPAEPANSAPEATSSPVDPASLNAGDILSGITKGQSTFTQDDLEYEIKKRLATQKDPSSDDPDRLRQIADAVKSHPEAISLGPDRTDRKRYTSRDMLNTELEMRDLSDRLKARPGHAVKDNVREASPTAAQLNDGQRKALDHILKPDGLAMVTGPAGSGKSHTLRAAKEVMEGEGYRVSGAAVAGIAAHGLQKDSGIKSRTLESLLWNLENVGKHESRLAAKDAQLASFNARGAKAKKFRADLKADRDRLAARIDGMKLTSRDVIFLDEAGMVGSRQMKRLLDHADKAKAKVVLIGDSEQLQAIDAGGAFRALSERHGSVKISEVRRQEIYWQKQATKDFSDGFTADALEAYRAKGFIHEAADTETARKRLIKEWTASRSANPDQTHLMLAFTRNDVKALNQDAREAYRKEGRLGVDEVVKTEQGKRNFARGDRLFFLEPNKGLGVMNGSIGTVEKIERHAGDKHHRITVKVDSGDTVQFRTDEYPKFDHAYAATMHKSQGATSHRAHVLASKYMDRHAAYVAMSRHVKQVDMYYGADEMKNFDSLIYSLSRDRRKDTTLDYLDRAEKANAPEKFWAKVRNVVMPKETTEEKTRRRFAEALGIRKKSDEDKSREHLRAMLKARPDQKKTRGFAPSI